MLPQNLEQCDDKKYITITTHKIILTNLDQHKTKLYSSKYKTSQQLTMKTIKIQLKIGFLMPYANL